MKGLHKTNKEIRSELKLIETAKRNSRAFAPLYERYYKPIYLFIYKRVDDHANSDDITSQVFLKAMMALPSYQFKGVPFSAWLFRIASNEINLYFRDSQKQRAISLEDGGISRLTEAILQTNTVDKTELIIACLNKLSPSEIEIIELRYFEKRSFKEVAFILGIKENNAKVKTHRIIERLKKIGKGMIGDE